MPSDLPSRTRLSRYDKFVRLTVYTLPLAGIILLLNSLNGWQKAPLACTLLLQSYLICTIWLYRHYRYHLQRQWQHLSEALRINEITAELARNSAQYQTEEAFLEDLLRRAVMLIPGAEMGCLIKLLPGTGMLRYEAAIGMDLVKLRRINLPLEHTFQYKLTQGRCNKTLLINDLSKINATMPLSEQDKELLVNCSDLPIRATLATPIHIDGQLYGMINMDSSKRHAFTRYDSHLMAILARDIRHAITIYQQSRRIYQRANTDQLTGLANRQQFELALQAQPEGTLLLIDMDNLKQLNDSCGHLAGDQALRLIADGIRQHFGQGVIAARFGGDEFVLLTTLAPPTLQQTMTMLATMLASASPTISCSMGMAPYRGDFAAAFARADAAMYQHKRRRKEQQAAQMPAIGESINH
ncbi:GGDEF domain-containing protein [Aeromonas veronii]|uniref:diguanylate cyclase n=1 Tax=Aeromonas veronii TaxID=654 RepID=A0A6S5CLS1_AERVE|nr:MULTISPECIES: sensor domain-containing diguanylate cyclase [Aeromonas]BBR40961.1 GGDEF domain-containing protein [Aeromonas veronii]